MNESKSFDWFNNLTTDDLDDVKLDFAVAVEEALISSGKKRSDLAKDLNVSGARITKVLRGDANLTMEIMHKIASALGQRLHIDLAPKGVKVHKLNIITAANNQVYQPRTYRITSTQSQLINPIEFKKAA